MGRKRKKKLKKANGNGHHKAARHKKGRKRPSPILIGGTLWIYTGPSRAHD